MTKKSRHIPTIALALAFVALANDVSIKASAQTALEIDHVTDLLVSSKGLPLKRICTMRIDQFVLPCNDAVFIEYKDGGHVIQFNRGTKESPVISFTGKLTDANTLTFNAASLRLGNRTAAFEDVSVQGTCLLGTETIGCVGRISDGRLIITQIFNYGS